MCTKAIVIILRSKIGFQKHTYFNMNIDILKQICYLYLLFINSIHWFYKI